MYEIFLIDLQFCTRMEVLQTFKPVKSKMKTTYQTFMRKQKLSNVLPA